MSLPDVSGSIDRESLKEAFKAIQELVSQLHRGDRLTIIPILGDAEAEASGRVIRFEIATERQAYDTDLRNFKTTLKRSLEKAASYALSHPGSRTDIMGAIALAEQEFNSRIDNSNKVLVLLSDFIEEDQELNFRT